MEWLRNIFQYSSIEKELLAHTSENSLYERYNRILNIDGINVYVVVAPSSNSRKLPKTPPIVLIHGLGGSMQSFTHIAQMLNGTCDIVLVDLPGNGKSPDPPRGSNAFSPDGIVEILNRVIEETCDPELPFIVLGHSYGTTHALRVSTGRLQDRCSGIILVAPPYGKTISWSDRNFSKYIPIVLFDSLFRARFRQGGLYSPSISRMVAPHTGEKARKDQMRVNLTARSNTVLLTIADMSIFDVDEVQKLPECPVLIISAAEDKPCPPQKAQRLYDLMKERGKTNVELVDVSNAGHAVLFERPRVVDGIISSFLRDNVDERLSMNWQLSYLASLDNKWSLKNEKKWKETLSVGDLIDEKKLFKGMKVPREGDENHGPAALENSHPEISAIIDISREAPPYDPSAFKRIKYHKFPTVSKIPPSASEVKEFIELVEEIKQSSPGVIGVHCHYGFNRTGFLICSYLIEKEGYNVNEALRAYEKSRPTGIRHQHFINELHVRYSL